MILAAILFKLDCHQKILVHAESFTMKKSGGKGGKFYDDDYDDGYDDAYADEEYEEEDWSAYGAPGKLLVHELLSWITSPRLHCRCLGNPPD